MEKKYYIGMDVHKAQTTYSVKDWKGATITSGKVASQYQDIQSVLGEYLKTAVIAMEACTYYYSIYKRMKENNIDVCVANVIHLRKVIGKNDKLDAERLADMLRLNMVPESFIPDDKVQNLRSLIHIYHKSVEESVRYKNQVHAVIDRNGICIPRKDIFSKLGMVCLNQYLLKSNDYALRILLDALNFSNQRLENMKYEIIGYLNNHFPEEFKLLVSIPGVGETLAGYLISEIYPIERFANKKKLRRYAGVIPIREESDKKVYATYLPKHASRYKLRYAIVLAANCAVRTECRLRMYYKKKKKGSIHARAIMCVASSLSDIIFNVLRTRKPYTDNTQHC